MWRDPLAGLSTWTVEDHATALDARQRAATFVSRCAGPGRGGDLARPGRLPGPAARVAVRSNGVGSRNVAPIVEFVEHTS